MRGNSVGDRIQAAWSELPNRFPGLKLDMFVVMPNHVHGIIMFVGAGLALPSHEGAANMMLDPNCDLKLRLHRITGYPS